MSKYKPYRIYYLLTSTEGNSVLRNVMSCSRRTNFSLNPKDIRHTYLLCEFGKSKFIEDKVVKSKLLKEMYRD